MTYFPDFISAIENAKRNLLEHSAEVDTGRWQGVPTEGKPDLMTMELMNWTLSVPVHRPVLVAGLEGATRTSSQLSTLREEIKPNLPWADDHFEERVSRVPTNPGEQYKNWPWWTPEKEEYTHALESVRTDFKFTHTYQERFWPKHAAPEGRYMRQPIRGIRYPYGDLDDVVAMLEKNPYTRQAYFPIFFPEDTGAVHGGRIPCTLGYQFLLRNNKLHMWYFIRSCDYVRHFRDDIYLACRLLLWVLSELQERELRKYYNPGPDEWQIWVDVDPGYLHMTICSLHYHKGDEHLVK